MSAPDLDDTTGCPLGVRCECCGVEAPDLAVATARVGALGVLCLTMCPGCAVGVEVVSPPLAVGTAARLVAQHCGHLGITVDDMAEALDAGGDR